MRTISIAIVALIIASCSSIKERQVARDHAACLDLGFQQGTEGYGYCRLALKQKRATIAAGIIAAP